MRRTLRSLVVLPTVLLLFGACGERDTLADDVRDIIEDTRHRPVEIVYRDKRADAEARVSAVVEDDFRFKALVAYGDAQSYEQVVLDDALALRFVNPAHVNTLIDRNRLESVDLHTDREGITVVDALESGRWVIDGGGAPLVARAPLGDELGRDFVVDALTSLDYVQRAVSEAAGVNRWSKDDLSPAYTSSEDTFPEPEDGSGVTRYDLVRPDLPAGAAAGGSSGGETQVLATRHFRKMAIYVKGDRVIRVIERVEVRGKQTDDLIDYLDSYLRESKAPAAYRRQFREMLSEAPPEEIGATLLSIVNALLQTSGQDPVVVREMTLDLKDAAAPVVALPQGDVINAPLDVLTVSSAAQQQDEGANAADRESIERQIEDTLGGDDTPVGAEPGAPSTVP